jgi:hypothetical protein
MRSKELYAAPAHQRDLGDIWGKYREKCWPGNDQKPRDKSTIKRINSRRTRTAQPVEKLIKTKGYTPAVHYPPQISKGRA